ncbi:MAG TPA: hypothetical protein VNO32_54100, partial [Candidatus Acidoferrum sp.]|nr:hypothetical protein [Candidatus Acidoferrum sp.]
MCSWHFCVLLCAAPNSCTVAPLAGGAGGGFPVTTQTWLLDAAGNIIADSPTPGIAVTGVWLSDGTGAAGSVYNFNVMTDFNGNASVYNGRVNANWSSAVYWNPGCDGVTYQSDYFYSNPIIGVNWVCKISVNTESGNSSVHFVLPGGVPRSAINLNLIRQFLDDLRGSWASGICTRVAGIY